MPCRHSTFRNITWAAKTRLMKGGLALGLLALAGAIPGFAQFGDVMTVNGLSPIPSGWVVIKTTGRAMMSSTPLAVENLTHTIKDLNDAPKGTTETILGSSQLPGGWLVIEVKNPPANTAHPVLYVIQKL